MANQTAVRAIEPSGISQPLGSSNDQSISLSDQSVSLSEQAVDSGAAVDAAAKLLSETAHDLRSPLTGVREAIRLIHDGDAGPVTMFQQELLADALGQCDAIQQLADNMLRVDRLRNGAPAIVRRWIAPAELREASLSVLNSIAVPRRVTIAWEGFETFAANIYGDVNLLRRLLINLAGNAIAISEERSAVLISLTASLQRGMARLSVIDAGPGMSADEMIRMTTRGHSGTGSTGLGLAICRSLAALHFARLAVLSRLGHGTRVSIDLPAGGPASVADAFARWREIVAPPRGSLGPRNHDGRSPSSGPSPSGRRHQALHQGVEQRPLESGLRVDSPPVISRGAYKDEAIIPFDGLPPRNADTLQVVGLRVSPDTSAARLSEVDALLQREQRLHELTYRTDLRRWVMLLDVTAEQLADRQAELQRRLAEQSPEIKTAWLPAQMISVSQRGNRGVIREVLVRDTLHANSRAPMFDDQESRGGGTAVTTEDRSTQRLEDELRHLSQRMKKQSSRLQRQAKQLGRLGD
jgi:hypothetical protein